MGEYATDALRQAIRSGRYWSPPPPVPHHDKVACPICNQLCGGRGFDKFEGVHQHMKFKHGIRQKWKREQLLSENRTH